MSEQQIPEVSFDFDGLITDAQNATGGLSDFGDDSFLEPMRVLLEGLEREANLNAVGRFMQHGRVLNVLINRLRMEAWISKYPEVLDEEVVAPVVIVGLPRTGTTMLHRIMASDSRFYAPLWYEVRNPAPYMDWDFKSEDKRIAEATAEVDAMLEANPELASIHPMDPVGADEEIMLLENSFYSTVPEAYCNLPTFSRWLDENDNTPGYEFLKRSLQFLQWQKKRCGQTAQRWLLKTPHHLHYMSTLLKVFPDAQVLQTHRDPLQTIPSISSFNYNLWILCADNVDYKVVGEHWARKWCNGMLHTMETRKAMPESFQDIWYKDTVTKPFDVIQQAYDFIGMSFTDEAREAMEQWRRDNPREARPPHEYSMEEFGFTEQGLKDQFAAYRAAYIENEQS